MKESMVSVNKVVLERWWQQKGIQSIVDGIKLTDWF